MSYLYKHIYIYIYVWRQHTRVLDENNAHIILQNQTSPCQSYIYNLLKNVCVDIVGKENLKFTFAVLASHWFYLHTKQNVTLRKTKHFPNLYVSLKRKSRITILGENLIVKSRTFLHTYILDYSLLSKQLMLCINLYTTHSTTHTKKTFLLEPRYAKLCITIIHLLCVCVCALLIVAKSGYIEIQNPH